MSLFGVELNSQINKIVHTIKLTLAKNKFMPNFRTIYRSLIGYDQGQSGLISAGQFEKALGENGVFLKKYEIQIIEKAFSKEGKIDWFGFMGLFRGTINSRRQDTIAAVFDSLDEAKTGKIHYAALINRFDPSEINEFKLGLKSKDAISNEMLGLVPLTSDGSVTREEFINFYSDLSINIPSDETFCKFVCGQWGCQVSTTVQPSKEQIKQAIKLIRFKLLQRTEGTHEEFILKKIFNEFDVYRQGFLDREALITMLVKLEIPTESRLLEPLLLKMDYKQEGHVDFDEFKNFIFFDPYPI